MIHESWAISYNCFCICLGIGKCVTVLWCLIHENFMAFKEILSEKIR